MSQLTRRNILASGLAAGLLPVAAHAQSNAMDLTNLSQDLQSKPGGPDFFDLDTLAERSRDAQLNFLAQSGFTATASQDANRPWQMFLDHFADYVSGGQNKNVQLVTVPRAATWTDPKYGPYRFCKVLGDSMPKWRSTYEPVNGDSFGNEYGIFLGNLFIPAADPKKQRLADKARIIWQVASTKLQNWVETSGNRWTVFERHQKNIPARNRLSYDEWYKMFEVPMIASLQDAVSERAQTYTSYLNQASGGYGLISQTIRAFSQQSATFLTPAEGTGKATLERVYQYTVGDDLDGWVKASSGAAPNAVSWDFKNDWQASHSTASSWGASGSYGYFFHANAGGSNSHLDTHSAAFHMQFNAKAIQRFDIIPGDWYSAEIIKMFKNGKFTPGGPIDLASKANTLWRGEKGIFSLRTAALICVYQPSISITMSKADYERNASSWQGGGGIGIGPFSFGGSAGGSNQDIKTDSTKNSISATDNSGVPKIIATVTDVLPDFT